MHVIRTTRGFAHPRRAQLFQARLLPSPDPTVDESSEGVTFGAPSEGIHSQVDEPQVTANACCVLKDSRGPACYDLVIR